MMEILPYDCYAWIIVGFFLGIIGDEGIRRYKKLRAASD